MVTSALDLEKDYEEEIGDIEEGYEDEDGDESSEYTSDVMNDQIHVTADNLSDAMKKMLNKAAQAEQFLIDHILLLIKTKGLPADFDFVDHGNGNFDLSYQGDEFDAKISYHKGKATFYTLNTDAWHDVYYFNKQKVLIHEFTNKEELEPEEKVETVIQNQDIIEAFMDLLDYPWATLMEIEIN